MVVNVPVLRSSDKKGLGNGERERKKNKKKIESPSLLRKREMDFKTEKL